MGLSHFIATKVSYTSERRFTYKKSLLGYEDEGQANMDAEDIDDSDWPKEDDDASTKVNRVHVTMEKKYPNY